ncbi:zinc-binding dehydrogenase [Actinomycetospora straminea]|uniref:Zinc-binding dehydrogenase n=1 Tax=Actinomycetospora straminea TaxID=663607 RepID=A0ABP9E998_9PSEU|nr:zinc-binding dehydrogenase [Actinomycetospora straminea]MDD7935976.1 zinc-binding dehydrogenase [Actinomycetospora straminea]
MTVPPTMRALRQTSSHGPRDLVVHEVPVPEPRPGEVLVRVGAAGVNVADLQQAYGTFGGGPQPPYVAGIEAAGEVVRVGEGVTTVAPGAHVVGACIAGGAFADYAVLPAAGALPVPAGWTDEQAVGLVVNWPTAIAALGPLGGLRAGQTVLVHAAAGATGQAAVTLARHRGATVVGAASADKHAVVRERGADHVVDARADDLAADVLRATGGVGVDLVLESVGGPTLPASLAVTRRVTGRVVVLGMAGGPGSISTWDLVYRHQVQVVGLNIGVLAQAAPHVFGEVLQEMAELLAAGVIAPGAPTTHALTDGPKALAELEARATVGKLALLP